LSYLIDLTDILFLFNSAFVFSFTNVTSFNSKRLGDIIHSVLYIGH